jgi:hypothetical protein
MFSLQSQVLGFFDFLAVRLTGAGSELAAKSRSDPELTFSVFLNDGARLIVTFYILCLAALHLSCRELNDYFQKE